MDVIAMAQDKLMAELATIQDQITLVQSWLGAVSPNLPTHREFASGASAALEEYKAEVADFGRAVEAGEIPGAACPKWGIDALAGEPNALTRCEPADGGRVRVCFAGFRGRELSILAEGDGEAAVLKEIYAPPILEMFRHFQETDKLTEMYLGMWVYLQACNGTSQESPEEIVQRHIRLLKEYNDMKDIGQQMIGLISENRGVQISTLYEGGDYGVTADD